MNTSGEFSWGNSTWVLIHTVLANYEPSKRDAYLRFFTELKNILPCSYCRISYNYFLELIPIENYLSTRMHAMYWGYLLHDMVNIKLGKVSPSFIEILKCYEKYRAKPKSCPPRASS